MRGFAHREPGMVGAAFDSPETIGELIADVSRGSCSQALIKQKTPQGVALITDCMSAGGCPKDYMLGELPVIVEKWCRLPQRRWQSSWSNLQLKDGVKDGWLGTYDSCSSLTMATSVPAKSVGLENGLMEA